MIALPIQVKAAQFDAPYYALEKRNKDAWAQQDKQIDEKLAALEKKFGKKPNIIYILADDVGWGEMGWQGGGKHRGTPTPELDKMAREGMRFFAAYSEPSCTPSRIAINTGRHPVRTGVPTFCGQGQRDFLPKRHHCRSAFRCGLQHRHVGQVASRRMNRARAGKPGLRLRVLRPVERRAPQLAQLLRYVQGRTQPS